MQLFSSGSFEQSIIMSTYSSQEYRSMCFNCTTDAELSHGLKYTDGPHPTTRSCFCLQPNSNTTCVSFERSRTCTDILRTPVPRRISGSLPFDMFRPARHRAVEQKGTAGPYLTEQHRGCQGAYPWDPSHLYTVRTAVLPQRRGDTSV